MIKLLNIVRCNPAWYGFRLRYAYLTVFLSVISLSACRSGAESVTAGMAEVNAQASASFLAMDYNRAAELYRSVPGMGGNRLEWLSSYVGMMEICQRVSDNVGFYEYRNMALQELRELEQESGQLPDSLQKKIFQLQTELRLVSAEYYRELEQNTLANRELRLASEAFESSGHFLQPDTATGIKVKLMNLSDPVSTPAYASVAEMVESYKSCIRHADAAGCQYVKGLAELYLARYYLNCGEVTDATLTALGALADFLHHGAEYEAIECYELLGSCAIVKADYEEALSYLIKAVDCLNDCRDLYWPDMEDLPFLDAYRFDNEIVELSWLERCPMSVVPELMSSVREQMSLAYSGLGDKSASDYNRNVCLELQKSVRLDRKYEARKELLERSNKQLTVLMIVVAALLLALVLFYLVFGRRIKNRNDGYVRSLESLMGLCESILALSQDGTADLRGRLKLLLEDRLQELVGAGNAKLLDNEEGIKIECSVNDAQAVVLTVQAFVDAAIRNSMLTESLDSQQDRLEKENDLTMRHTLENRRQNLVRKACCSVVQDCAQLVERLDVETARLELESNSDLAGHRLEYIRELTDRICRYYDILSHWGRLRQGEVSLHIENFELRQVLDLLRFNSRNFERAGVDFKVADSDAMVKADRALTLFMLNTLADNARKFTPAGGRVEIEVEDHGKCVQISVSDTGVGISPEDLSEMLENKVYNPDSIGRDSNSAASKGSGFGIMNCKGIIESYKKEGEFFDCCELGANSKIGEGSRIWFTLPKYVRRILSIIALLVLSTSFSIVSAEQAFDSRYEFNQNDSLLDLAYEYAENVYKLNVEGCYSQALACADTSISLFNEDWLSLGGDSALILYSESASEPAELAWFERKFPTDYETLLWLRNEMAVSALALSDWTRYSYNNDAYLKLFKLYFSESEIEEYCRVLQRSNANLTVAIVLLLLLITLILFLRFVLHSRGRLRYRSDLKQLLDVMSRIQDSISVNRSGMQSELDVMTAGLMEQLQHLLPVRALSVMVVESGIEYVSCSGAVRFDEAALQERLNSSFLLSQASVSQDGLYRAVPLVSYYDSNDKCIGSLALAFTQTPDRNDLNTIEILAGYMATALSGYVLRKAQQLRNVEFLEEESQELEFERDRLHVENMVLDNCLSTLRHETLWYPSRIGQLAQKYMNQSVDIESIKDIRELAAYYRQVFEILGRRASRQLSEFSQRPQTVSVAEIYGYAAESMKRMKLQNININYKNSSLLCSVDVILAKILVEGLMEQFTSNKESGELCFSANPDGDFVSLTIEDLRTCNIKNPELMFTPLWGENNLGNVVCSQALREIDSANGHIGCRINAEITTSGHLEVTFTLPQAVNNNE